ncbi:putative A/G-specific adenine glycosylase [Leptospira broomii serovar Hurstbridge str. 5399]|uniref:Adenine DNA glycosylase n=1 Tax=Leptospira broomii serovar Hurstbridge str. 5399 TaxID=1049789 RepID=T0GPP9_9LEPT|nr:A/G-specific adenine glycosylase [Leptospira broomii]EQA47308.1 putative A/G-specific adenine glycosylase [Leptospira broomii serovar Hurstbridge str. 5399]
MVVSGSRNSQNKFDENFLKSTRTKLRGWFLREKRDLPFRQNRTPYSTWVSEVMLQQTRVTTMIPLYESFLQRFPKPSDLAEAEEEEVLRYWKGLGYYSRAKNLHKGVRKLVSEFSGIFPRTLEGALSLPGVGQYTASAILSISYNIPLAVLDGNAKRVLSRLFLFRGSPSKSASILQELADQFLDRDYAGDHNESVMELGARICLPTTPLCGECPLQKECEAYREGVQQEIPIAEKKSKEIALGIRFLIVRAPAGILLLRYSKRRFFKTIFTLPFTWDGKSPYAVDPVTELDLTFHDTGTKFRHTITHHKIVGSIWEASISAKQSRDLVDSIRKKHVEVDYKWCEWDDLETECPSSIAGKIKSAVSPKEPVLPGIPTVAKKAKGSQRI